jgi:hypothetical protein
VLPIGRVLLAARHINAATAVMLTAYDYSTLLLEENLHSIFALFQPRADYIRFSLKFLSSKLGNFCFLQYMYR